MQVVPGPSGRVPCAGKNRPLDPDEAEFIDAIAERDRTREASARAEDATAMEAYQLVRRQTSRQAPATAPRTADSQACLCQVCCAEGGLPAA